MRTQTLRSEAMSTAERLDQIAEILAVGLVRLTAKRSSQKSADCGESYLDCDAHQSGPASANPMEENA
jgi:hypothetical protein